LFDIGDFKVIDECISKSNTKYCRKDNEKDGELDSS